MSSDSATVLMATQQSIKAFVENLITQQDLDIAVDSGTAQSIDLNSETLTFSGGSNIGSSVLAIQLHLQYQMLCNSQQQKH